MLQTHRTLELGLFLEEADCRVREEVCTFQVLHIPSTNPWRKDSPLDCKVGVPGGLSCSASPAGSSGKGIKKAMLSACTKVPHRKPVFCVTNMHQCKYTYGGKVRWTDEGRAGGMQAAVMCSL